MKTDPHTRQIIETAHRIIRHMSSLIENFHADDEHWKVAASLLKYDAQHIERHLGQHLELVLGLKEESE